MKQSKEIQEFLALRSLAVVGVSRSGRGFGSAAFRGLRQRRYEVLPVNSAEGSIDGIDFVPSLDALAGKVEGAVLVVPPNEALQCIRQAAAAGIRYLWLQRGSESPAALQLCRDLGLSSVHGECILMFAGPQEFPHSWHRKFREWTSRPAKTTSASLR